MAKTFSKKTLNTPATITHTDFRHSGGPMHYGVYKAIPDLRSLKASSIDNTAIYRTGSQTSSEGRPPSGQWGPMRGIGPQATPTVHAHPPHGRAVTSSGPLNLVRWLQSQKCQIISRVPILKQYLISSTPVKHGGILSLEIRVRKPALWWDLLGVDFCNWTKTHTLVSSHQDP